MLCGSFDIDCLRACLDISNIDADGAAVVGAMILQFWIPTNRPDEFVDTKIQST